MALTSLHQFSQDLFTRLGTCYYQCEYVRNEPTLWKQVKTYADAVSRARDFRNYVAMTNYANSRSSQNIPQDGPYAVVAGALTANSLYSCEFYVASPNQAPTSAQAVNHEIILITGADSTVCYFDPNSGFYQSDATGLPAGTNNRAALEQYLASQYTGNTLYNFRYYRRRALA